MDNQEYLNAKNKAVNFFRNNKTVESLCFDQIVINSDGLMHLMWLDKKRNRRRDIKNQIKRFHLLDYLKPVMKGMEFYQEYCENLESFKTKKGSQIIKIEKIVKYWAFIAVIKNKIRIKIVLRKVGEGVIHFWSIIPIWKTKYYKGVRVVELHKGNLKED